VYVWMPLPPIPQNILAAMSSGIDRARPQATVPTANQEYAKSKHGFLPNMSLNLPYSGLVQISK
jgi:hypothetical protein